MTRSEHRDGVGATMTDGDDGTPDRSAAPDAHNPARDPTTPTVPAEAPEAGRRDEQATASLVAPASVATPPVVVPEPWRRPPPVTSTRSWPAPRILGEPDARSATRLTPDPAAVVEQPTRGWRALVYGASGGRWNPGLSRAEKVHRAGLQRTTTPLFAPHTVAVVSLKGCVGRTTLAALLSLYLAETS